MNRIYIAVNGDTWDSIAFKTIGDEFMCDKVAAANSRDYSDVVMFEGGERIVIPDILVKQSTIIKAPWSK